MNEMYKLSKPHTYRGYTIEKNYLTVPPVSNLYVGWNVIYGSKWCFWTGYFNNAKRLIDNRIELLNKESEVKK
jgi:hypothetical protein